MLLVTSRRFRRWFIAAAVPLTYAAIYINLLERKVYRQFGVDPATGQNLLEAEPRYRINEAWVAAGLRPAYAVDRYIRDDYWTTIEHSSERKWKNPKSAGVTKPPSNELP